jgi:hypothetical protein
VLAVTSRKIEMQSDHRASDIKGRGSSPIRPKRRKLRPRPARGLGPSFLHSALYSNLMRLTWSQDARTMPRTDCAAPARLRCTKRSRNWKTSLIGGRDGRKAASFASLTGLRSLSARAILKIVSLQRPCPNGIEGSGGKISVADSDRRVGSLSRRFSKS